MLIIIIILIVMLCLFRNKENNQHIEPFLDDHDESYVSDFSPYSYGFNVSKDSYYPQSLWYRNPYSIYLWETMFWKHALWNNAHSRQFFGI